MSKKKKRKVNPKQAAAVLAGAILLLTGSFYAVKEYRIRSCVADSFRQIEAVLGPCPDNLRPGVTRYLRNYCETEVLK